MIIVRMFHDRSDELDALRAEHERDLFSLVIIYGCRRVGKTELIKAFCENSDHLYHLASQDSAKVQQEQLVEELAAYRNERVRAPKTGTMQSIISANFTNGINGSWPSTSFRISSSRARRFSPRFKVSSIHNGRSRHRHSSYAGRASASWNRT
jgi:AAA+ ATPase superfamily predicted ATPase